MFAGVVSLTEKCANCEHEINLVSGAPPCFMHLTSLMRSDYEKICSCGCKNPVPKKAISEIEKEEVK